MARGIQGVHERVVMREVHLAVEEVSGVGEGLWDVGEHVDHGLVDSGSIGGAVDPLAILGENGKVEGFGGTVPAEVGKRRADAEFLVERDVLGCVGRSGPEFARDRWGRGCNAFEVEAVEVVRRGGDRRWWGYAAGCEIRDLGEACYEGVGGGLGLLFFVVANRDDFAG